MGAEDESFKVRIPEIRDVRETLRVPVEGYGLCTAMSRGGRVIALGGMVPGQHGLIHMFDNTGKRWWHHKTREAISTVAVCRSGEFIAAASDDNNIYFFDKRGLLQWRHEAARLIKSMAMSDNGDFLAVGSEDSNLYFFDRNRQIKKFAWKFRFEGSVVSVAMSSAGRQVAAGSADRTVAYFDQGGQLLWSQEAREAVTSVGMSADGGLVAAGSSDSHIYLFNGTGTLLRTHDCGAPVTAVAVSARGDCILAAAGPDLLCVDQQGARLWTVPMGSGIIRLAASESADSALVATEDKGLTFVARPGAVAWRYTAASGIYGLALSDDREMALCCGPGSLDYFEGSKIFRELVSRHQLALAGLKKAGQDVSAQEAVLRTGINSLGTRSYPALSEGLKEIQDSLLAMDRISLERQKLRDDTAGALARLVAAGNQARTDAGASEDALLKELDRLSGRAEQSFRAGKYGEALADVRKAEEAIVQLRQNRSGRTELMMLIESVQGQILEARRLEVDVSSAESHLERARSSLRTGNLQSAQDEAQDAANTLHRAKTTSPRAVQAGFDTALKMVDSPTASESDLRLAEESIAAAIPTLLRDRDFDTLAESYEKLSAGWARRPASPEVLRGSRTALEMAVAAYRDGGRLDKAIRLCREAEDWNTAAKLLLVGNDRERASESWTRAATAKRPRPGVPEEVRVRVESELARGQYLDAAAALAGAGFLPEAAKVLGRAPPSGRTAAFLFRVLFNLQDIAGVLDRARSILPALRKRARDTGEAADHAAYAHVLVGTLEMARLLDSPDLRVLSTELGEFAHEYTRALSRDEVKASEICDLTVLHAYLLERNWKAVERLSELKGGPTWDHLRAALEAWRRVDLRAFQEHSRAFRQSRPDRVWWPTQTLPDVVPPANAHEALNALAPFNHVLLVHGMLDRLSNKDYLVSMVKRADGEMAAGREERAAALYENALALDTFAFLDARRIHMRLAGYMLSQRRETEAAPHLEAARAGRDAALAEFRSLRGLLPPGGRRAPPAAAKAPAAQPQGPAKNACPKCGAAIPGKAIRCFKCGKSLK
jgi:outer membrane protein assembly factor BamB/tetratricopeptide (TPR) repeat protein